MKIPGYAIRIILVLLFFVAAGARFASTGESTYPYFQGKAAMNYRDATTVSDGGDLGQLTKKSDYPHGYRPNRARAAGVPYLMGHSFRVARYFGELDARKFSKRFLVFFFCLSIFAVYALTAGLWRSQAAGIMAAVLFTFLSPLIEISNGKSVDQIPFAIVIACFHILALQIHARGGSWLSVAAAGLFAYFLMGVWDAAPYYLAAVVFLTGFWPGFRMDQKRKITAVHLAVFLAAAVLIPHLRSSRAAFSWQAVLLLVCLIHTLRPDGVASGRKRPWAIMLLTIAVAIALTPLRAGADYQFPGLGYAFYRIRFLADRPLDPGMLPDMIRSLWSVAHAPPSAHVVLGFFLPLLFFVPATVLAFRRTRHGDQPADVYTRRFLLATAVCALFCAFFVFDRSAIAIAAVATVVLVALGAKGIDSNPKVRGPLLAVGILMVLTQILMPYGSANPTFQIAKSAGFAHRDQSKFLWVSFENTDRELIRFVSTRTSVPNAILGKPEITAILLAFSGRTSVLLSGGLSDGVVSKQVRLMRLFYGDEQTMYEKCRELGVDYILYSIDILLDTTRYSPAYFAGVTTKSRDCLAFAMHFDPESLRNFNLVYENDHYRLFRVTAAVEPIFHTDHPLVYQREIFDRFQDSYETFYERHVELTVTYIDAINSQTRGDNFDAFRKLKWCLRQAPRFTKARIGLGKLLLQMGRDEEARDELLSVIGYAPDNADALYYAAYALTRLEDRAHAKGLLEVLFSSSTDTKMLDKARLLDVLIDRGTPLTPSTILE